MEARGNARMALCPACLLSNGSRRVHQAQMTIQSSVVSRESLAKKLRRCADVIVRDPEIVAYVVDDMEDEEQFADMGAPAGGQKTRHTPGPWTLAKNGTIYARNFDKEIVSFGTLYSPEEEANAALVAAAPDLLEACRAAHVSLIGDEDYAKHRDLVRTLDAAIAKATGGAHMHASLRVEIVEHGPKHKLVKIIKRGRVYASVYAEPFPSEESALRDYKEDPGRFRPFNESDGGFCQLPR